MAVTKVGVGPATAPFERTERQSQLYSMVDDFRAACDDARRGGLRLGFVPTMGGLHAGHESLIQEAAKSCGLVAVSIFLNPTQFSSGEDLGRYPGTLEIDREVAQRAGCQLIFAPTVEQMYPRGESTTVRVGRLTEHLCGPHRPEHFEGVATIVTKLLACVGPCAAFFGRKDYQQLKVVERLVRDLCLPVQVVGLPTVRESDGLAMSTRNAYLAPPERKRARALASGLSGALRTFQRGERQPDAVVAPLNQAVADARLRADYITLADPETLVPLPPGVPILERSLLAVAVRIGSARLIDNVVLGEDTDPLEHE